MIKRLYYTILVGVLMQFCSCSEAPSVDEVTQNKKEIISELNQLHADGFITQQNVNDAIANIVSFEQRSFIGQYWWVILFVFLSFVLVITIVAIADFENDNLAHPMKKSKAYFVVGGLGFLGVHNICLKKYCCIGILTIFLTILFFFWNYKYVMYFYNLPSVFFISHLDSIHFEELGFFYTWQVVLVVLYSINLFTGLVLTPFWVYQFNGNYFRKHKDNDAILNGNSLEVDRFYNNTLIPHLADIDDDVEYVDSVLKDEDMVIAEEEDERISGFFKNLFTLGNSNKLKYKIQRLRALQNCCERYNNDLIDLELDNEELYSYLCYYRIAAFRNLFLAKEMIKVLKDNISSKEQQLIKDEFITLEAPKSNISTDLPFDHSQISFDTENFFDAVGDSFTKSIDSIGKKLENEKEITKSDFVEAGIEFAFDSIIAGIQGIFTHYHKVSESLKEVEWYIHKSVKSLGNSKETILKYQAMIARQSEIMIALSKNNKAFVLAYEPMREKVFGQPTFWKFMHGFNKEQGYFKSIEFRHDIHHLIQVCTEYNKIYNTKLEKGTRKAKIKTLRSVTSPKSTKATEIAENSPINDNVTPIPQVLDREFVLTTIRKVLKNKHIVEGNTLNFLDLMQNGPMVKNLCEELSAVSGKKIDKEDIFKRKNIREVIDLVLKNNVRYE